MKISAVKATL